MKNYLIIALVLILGTQVLSGQEAKTEKVRFRVNNLPSEPAVQIEDKAAPMIGIISPKAVRGKPLESENQEINLIGQVNDASEINMVSVDSKIVQVNNKGIFTTKLKLSEGQNEFLIVAIDAHNNMAEESVSITYNPGDVSTLGSRIVDESVYYALIIGINNYLDPAIQSLDNPISDAQKLYDVITDRYTFNKENIQFLKDARRTDIFYALDHLSRTVTAKDNLLIFYAGHGTFDQDANIGYWLPSDARKISKADWFRNSTLADYLKEIDTKHTLLITDACFGGSIFKMRSAFSDASPDIENLYELPSRKAMTSGALSEVPDQSSFTAYLISRLESNTNPYLSSEQLFSRFRTAVMNNSDTEPQFGEIKNVGDEGGDFIFVLRR